MKTIAIEGHCLEGSRTGVGRYLENILRELARIDGIENEFHFIIYTKEEKLQDDFLQSSLFTIKPLRVSFLPASFTLFFNILLPWALFRDDSDYVWFPSYMAPLWCPEPFLVTLHDIIFEVYPEGIPKHYLAIYKTFCPRAAKRANKIFTVSEFSKKEIAVHYNADPAKIQVTPLAPADKFRPLTNEDRIEESKEKYDLKDDYILYLGQIFNRRHVKETLKAFESIVGDFEGLQFFIVGTNRTVPRFDFEKKAQAVNQKLGYKAVVRLDYLPEEDMVPIINGASAFLYPSSYEGFGMPPLEAMACGTPAVSTKKTSLAEVVDDAAVLVEDPSDPGEIAKKLKKLLAKKDYKKMMIAKGKERAGIFDWKNTAQSTLEVLKEL